MPRNRKALIESISETINEIQEEPTDQELENLKAFVPDAKWDIVRCGGSVGTGCGSRFSLMTAKWESGSIICPKCGKRN